MTKNKKVNVKKLDEDDMLELLLEYFLENELQDMCNSTGDIRGELGKDLHFIGVYGNDLDTLDLPEYDLDQNINFNESNIRRLDEEGMIKILLREFQKEVQGKKRKNIYMSQGIIMGNPGKDLRFIVVYGKNREDLNLSKEDFIEIDKEVDFNGFHSFLESSPESYLDVVYMLSHNRNIKDEASETKLIGFYSSKQKAEESMEKYKKTEGFKDHPNNFIIEGYIVDFGNFNFE